MLYLERFLGKGATRLCFYHPEDNSKCVKVAMRYRNIPQLQKELVAVKCCTSLIGSYLPEYQTELIKTNLGPGLVCEIIRDDDGTPSRTLAYYVCNKQLDKRIMVQLIRFTTTVAEHNIPLYDFNPENFLIQKKEGKSILRFTDLKTYNAYKPYTYLRLERVVPAISRLIIKRRIKRLFNWIQQHS